MMQLKRNQMDKKEEKDKKEKDNQINEELKDFDVRVNPFGQIESNFDVDKVNEFLNENTEDKKIKGRKAGEVDKSEED